MGCHALASEGVQGQSTLGHLGAWWLRHLLAECCCTLTRSTF